MQARLVQEIGSAVKDFLYADQNWTRLARDDQRGLMDEIVAGVRARVRLPEGHPEDEFRMVVAMSWLGPDYDDIPPCSMRGHLLKIIRGAVPAEQERNERLLEFVMAYGCGWKRTAQAGRGGWTNRWGNAIAGIAVQMAFAAKEVERWLAETPCGFHGARRWNEILSDASQMALHFVEPTITISLEDGHRLEIHRAADLTEVLIAGADTSQYVVKPGSRFVFAYRGHVRHHIGANEVVQAHVPGPRTVVLSRDDDTWVSPDGARRIVLFPQQRLEIAGPTEVTIWQCACGHRDCPERHRIASWQPQVSLWAYVPSAVKGPQLTLQTGSVIKGMYVPLLAGGDAPRVREADVLYKLCPEDHQFERYNCLECKNAGNTTYLDGRIRTVTRRALIVEGASVPAYDRVQRIRCRNRIAHYLAVCQPPKNDRVPDDLGERWDNLYEIPTDQKGGRPQCPICGESPARVRPTHVWMRTFRHRVGVALDTLWLEEKREEGEIRDDGADSQALTGEVP